MATCRVRPVVTVTDPRHRTRTRLYRGGRLQSEDFPAEMVSEALEEPGTAVWIDLCAPDQSDLQLIASELGLHELAVEDARSSRQRPKLDHYDTHSFLNLYGVELDARTGELLSSELSAFLTRRALVTVRKDDRFDMTKVVERWDRTPPELLTDDIGFLLYGLLDYVVDGYFDSITLLDEEIEGLEDRLFGDGADVEIQRRSFELRKSLVLLRRVALPMREVLNSIMRRDTGLVQPTLMPYYQDVYDHVLRVTEWTESLRDLVSTIRETHLTIQGNRLNVITKKVTGWAAIIAVPTAITGFYGQNVPYPGFGKESGLYVSSALIAGLSVLLYLAFRWKDWI